MIKFKRTTTLLFVFLFMISLFSLSYAQDGSGGDGGGGDGSGGDGGGGDGSSGDGGPGQSTDPSTDPGTGPGPDTGTDPGNGDGDSTKVTVNTAPTLNPIGNKQVNEAQLLQFSISGSDPDGNALTFSASNLPAGATFSGNTFSWTPTFTQAGTYQVTFSISDGASTASETITITVLNVNRAPILNFIGNKTVNENQLLQFLISASDPDGNALTFSASNLPAGATFSGNTFSWTPSFTQSGVYIVTFTVSDGSLTVSETITITVLNVNRAPTLNPIGNKQVNEAQLLQFSISGSDADGNALTFSASNLPAGATFSGNTFSWTPSFTQSGVYIVTFTVSDGSLTVSETITITVLNVNRAPTLNAIGNKAVNENQLLQFLISASDPDGNALTFSASNLPAGATFSGNTFSWTPTFTQAGTYQVTFSISDGASTASETITITVFNMNRAPTLNAIGNKQVNEAQLLQFSISGSDPDGNALTFSASNLPAGATFAGQTFSWTPTFTQAGTYQVTFSVSDGASTASETITITVFNVNRAPTLNAIGNKAVNENQLLQFLISASDLDGDALVFSASNLPAGATFTGNTFSWTPAFSQSGSYVVTFIVSDGSLIDSETIIITVNNVNRAPTLNAVGNKQVNEGQLLQFSISGSDPDGNALTFSASNLPAGATFSGNTFSWTPTFTQSGVYIVTFTVSDGASTASETVTIAVNNVNQAPVLSIPDRAVNEDAGLLDNLVDLWSYVADDATAAVNMAFSIIMQTNANIISCSLDSNRFIDCVTQSNQKGFSDVTVSATDEGGLTTMDTFRINVLSVNDGPTVAILEPGSRVTEEKEFDFVAAASDIDSSDLTYTLDFGDGTVKTGNVINGRIKRTHTYAEQGTYTITVTVSDGSLTAADSKTVEAVKSKTSDVRNIIYVGGIAFDNEFPRPGDELRVFVNFENQGNDDLRDVRLTAIIQDLGIRSNTASADVKDGKGASTTLTLEIPEDAQAGRYWVEVVIDIDGDRRIKYRPIDII